MVSRFISRVLGWGGGSCSTLRGQRPGRRIAAAGRVIEAMEGRVLLSVLYVDASAPGPDYDGASWGTAYKDLQLALGAASAGDEIRIADGTYKPTSGSDRTISFALRDGVAIRGGYAGYGAADPEARDIAAYPTILSGDIGIVGSTNDNSYHVLTATGVGSLTVLDGITVTGGNANGSGLNGHGGGLYVTSGSPTLTNCIFSSNAASEGGGGTYNSSSSLTLIDCIFIGNSVTGTYGKGGGMYNASSSPRLTNCTFSGNPAYGGGGVYNASSSSPTLTNCIFSANSAKHSGGGMSNFGSSPTLTNCTFTGNSVTGTYGQGGGMYNASSSSPMLINCTISGNSASGTNALGGGMYNSSSSPSLTNCIIWGNIGGAISTNVGTPVITYSNIQGGYAGTGNIDADPLFVRMPWPGPDGLFGTADDDLGDLRLRPGSPSLNTGSNEAISAGVSTDLAGNARIQDSIVDMGAYEGTTAVVPKVLYVDAAAEGTNAGTSWADAFTSLQSALLVAWDGDAIRVAEGTYTPTLTSVRHISFTLRNSVAIYGGYAGYRAADPSARDILAYPTILSGDIGTAGTTTDNSYHVLVAGGVGASTLLDGVTVKGGNANGPDMNQSSGGGLLAISSSPMLINCTFSSNLAGGTHGSGAGMYNIFSSPTLTNCTFSGNSTTGTYGHGGGMYNASSSPMLINCTFSGNLAGGTDASGAGMLNATSSPTLVDCTFVGNSAGKLGGGMKNGSSSSPTLGNCIFSGNSAIAGGGMYNSISSSPTLTNCTFSGNSAFSGGGMYNYFSSSPMLSDCTFESHWASIRGGGMYNDSSSPTLTNCSFSNNSVSRDSGRSYGGGMYNSSASSPTLSNCVFSGNSANGTYSYGGGIYNDYSSPTLTYCTFSGNSATDNNSCGGGMSNNVSSPTLSNCMFNGNAANSFGGGMYNHSSLPTLTNCSFSGNAASSSGGGMYNNYQTSPTLINCTFSGNSASNSGGAMHNSSSLPTLTNCIIWGNTAKNSPQVYPLGGILITYSDIQGGHAGVGNLDADPLFVRSPSPGPDGLWNGVGDDYGDLRLQPNSPCIDAGNNAAAGLAGIVTDIAGNPRFVDIAFTPDTGNGTAPAVDMGAYEVQRWCPLWLDPAGLAAWNANAQTLDIGESSLVVAADDANRAERLEAVRRFIAAGRGGAAGIVSSAVGEDQAVIAALDDGGNILVRVALMGDVTLDDRLDGDDYFALDRAFLAEGGHEPEADLNVDGVIDGRDYFVLDARFLGVAGGVQALGAGQVAQRPPAGVFSGRSIVDEVLMEEEGVLTAV